MSIIIFEYTDYRCYVQAMIDKKKQQEKGYLGKLAKAAGCHLSYFSQVLRGNVQFTPDHAVGLALYWTLGTEETEYFLSIVNLERASSPALKSHLKNKIASLKQKHQSLTERLDPPKLSFQNEDLVAYYSDWIFQAIHMLASIPNQQSLQNIASRLRLPPEALQGHLKILEQLALVVQSADSRGEKVSITNRNIHIPQESPLCGINHRNWRMVAIDRQRNPPPENLHYSALYSLSKADCANLREVLLRSIQETRAIVTESPEEDVACFLLDFFVL